MRVHPRLLLTLLYLGLATPVAWGSITVTQISPSSGPSAGGTSVRISGTGFVSGATVSFGGAAATQVTVTSSTSITATTPAHSAGAVTVTVINPDNSSGSLSSTSLLSNAGFESGTSFWKWNGSGSAALLTTAATAHGGNDSYDLKAPAGSHPVLFAADASGSPRYFPVGQGDVVTFGGWAYRAAGDGLARFSIAVTDGNKANPTYVAASPSNVTTRSWILQQSSYTVPAGKAFIRFYAELFNSSVTAEARFDDAVLRKAGGYTYLGSSVSVVIKPRATSLTLKQIQPFTAVVSDSTNQAVTWTVDGIAGGDTNSGKITASGSYTPPGAPGTHSIKATSVADPTKSATATVAVTDFAGTLTYHNDKERTGQNLRERLLSPANVNPSRFGKLFYWPVDGYVYAQPLYVANVPLPVIGYRNVVYLVTAHDSVYAFDADSSSATPLWQRKLLGTGATPVPTSDFPGTTVATLFGPEIGITGTPVIDSGSQRIYLVAATKEGGKHVQRLHALDLATGSDVLPPTVIQGSVPGTGSGSSNGVLPFDPHQHLQRPGLALANGLVYVAFAAHYDLQPYHGWVFAYDAGTLIRRALYCVSPDSSDYGGGVWMSGSAPGIDEAGNVYVSTGNGHTNVITGGDSDGDSVVKLNGKTLEVMDWFAPSNQDFLYTKDYDLGSAGTLLLPDQLNSVHTRELLTYGKDPAGRLFLLDRASLGHYSATGDTQIVQAVSHQIGDGATFPRNMPAYWNGRIYTAVENDVIKAFSFADGLLSTTPVAKGGLKFGRPGATPSVSSNGTANGIVWTIRQVPGSAEVLHAFNAANVSLELYNSGQAGTRDLPSAGTTFSVPTIANGKVYVAGRTAVTVFGLLP